MYLGRWEDCSTQVQRLDDRGFMEKKHEARSESVLAGEMICET
jgi:hypothetical protein